MGNPPLTIVHGKTFKAQATTKNKARALPARPVHGVLPLQGQAPEPDRHRSAARSRHPDARRGREEGCCDHVTVPVATAAGKYWLLACADKAKVVTEANEKNNCHALPSRSP